MKLRKIGCAGPGIQLREKRIIQFFRFSLRYGVLRIINIAENDRLRGTDLLARRFDSPVGNVGVMNARGDFRFADALHAVRAFFHHA
ncbi:MAG TPA: hypothetical protein VHE81_06375, partial [Lacipirellulaceae bacterium]|nr:hypothetical protein [Lacipirellulaceae bacterium]